LAPAFPHIYTFSVEEEIDRGKENGLR
jgi:hypothetical protein